MSLENNTTFEYQVRIVPGHWIVIDGPEFGSVLVTDGREFHWAAITAHSRWPRRLFGLRGTLRYVSDNMICAWHEFRPALEDESEFVFADLPEAPRREDHVRDVGGDIPF